MVFLSSANPREDPAMERISVKPGFSIPFRNFKFRFGVWFTFSDEEPAIKMRPAPKRTVSKEKLGDYSPGISGPNLVIRTAEGMRVEIDLKTRIVQVDGKVDWVGTNFGGLEYGWVPPPVEFLPLDKPEEWVEWSVEYYKDRFENLLVKLTTEKEELRLAIHSKNKYVIVWDAAVKALLRGQYFIHGPERPLPAAFHQMRNERPKVVSIETFRTA